MCNSLVVTDDNQKLSLLLTLVGDEAYEIFENIAPQDEDKTFQEVVQLFENHFKPQVNISYETFLFRKMVQRADEATQQYYVRLHKQAAKCDFTDKDKEIKQQIELSTTNTKLRKYSFQNPGKSLNELLTMAKTFETMKIHTDEIEKQTEQEAVNKLSKKHSSINKNEKPKYVSSRESQRRTKNRSCYRCGGEFPHKQKCAAIGKTCHSCGKQDHFVRVCKSSQQSRKPKMGRNQRQGDYRKPLNTLQDTSESSTSSEEGKDYKQNDYLFKIDSKTEGKTEKQDFMVKVLIEKTQVELLIDTGASVNVLNENTFRKINKKLQTHVQLRKSKTKFVT